MPKGSWIAESPTGLPASRQWSAMAYHAGAPAHIILFGGYNGSALNDTHSWNGSAWSSLSPGTSPSVRFGHAMTSVSTGVLLFGGDSGSVKLDDTWFWNGTTWTDQNPTIHPDARAYTGLAQSPDTDYDLMLWGGNVDDTDVWLWDHAGGLWTAITPNLAPIARYKHAMWYDPNRGRIVIFGGFRQSDNCPLNDMWEWDGVNFTRLNTQVAPTARGISCGIAHDSSKVHAVSTPNGLRASGTISTIASADLSDGETVTLDDGVNTPTVFEFDKDESVTPGNVAVNVFGTLTADEVKDVLIAEINAAGSLDITAYDGGTGIITLYNDEVGSAGNQEITTTVSSADFEIVGMSGADVDAWTWNGVGALWVKHSLEEALTLPDGCCTVYDPIRDLVFCYAVDGQLKWTWDTLGLSPYHSYPGVLQGRIVPVQVDPQDGQYTYVLGADAANLPQYLLDIGDTLWIEQDLYIESGTKLIRFDWLMRYSPRMPKYRKVLDAGAVSFKTEKLIDEDTPRVGGAGYPGDGDTYAGVRVAQSIFRADDRDQALKITNATESANNTISARITAVPSGQGLVQYFDRESDGTLPAGSVAVIEKSDFVEDDDTGVTLEVLGVRWRASCTLLTASEAITRAELVEQTVQALPDGVWRGSMAMHVSQYSGSAKLRFQLSLDLVDS